VPGRVVKPSSPLLRPRRMRLFLPLAALAVAVSLTACGSGSAALSSGGSDAQKGRLLAAADAAAKNNGGKARHVEAVETTRGTAADLTGHSNLSQDEKVWVVQVSGDDYSCGGCSRPAGASSPSGKYLTLVLRAADYEGTDFGISPKPTDLAAFGHIQVLRDDR
jgi:hypothetical protein